MSCIFRIKAQIYLVNLFSTDKSNLERKRFPSEQSTRFLGSISAPWLRAELPQVIWDPMEWQVSLVRPAWVLRPRWSFKAFSKMLFCSFPLGKAGICEQTGRKLLAIHIHAKKYITIVVEVWCSKCFHLCVYFLNHDMFSFDISWHRYLYFQPDYNICKEHIFKY